jgi:hypothetical protein
MPSFQTVAERCNAIFSSENIPRLKEQVGLFTGAQSVGRIAVGLGLATADQGGYLDSMPEAMGAALKALVAANLLRERPFGMQFLWFEGAEWEFLISEVLPTDQADSRGGISLMLRSPKL